MDDWPFEDDFSGANGLSCEQKRWIVRALVEKRFSPAKLAHKLKMRPNTLRVLLYRHKKGWAFKQGGLEGRGRTKAFDNESMEKIEVFFHQDVTRQSAIALLENEFCETRRRRRMGNTEKTIGRATVYDYLKKFKPSLITPPLY